MQISASAANAAPIANTACIPYPFPVTTPVITGAPKVAITIPNMTYP